MQPSQKETDILHFEFAASLEASPGAEMLSSRSQARDLKTQKITEDWRVPKWDPEEPWRNPSSMCFLFFRTYSITSVYIICSIVCTVYVLVSPCGFVGLPTNLLMRATPTELRSLEPRRSGHDVLARGQATARRSTRALNIFRSYKFHIVSHSYMIILNYTFPPICF